MEGFSKWGLVVGYNIVGRYKLGMGHKGHEQRFEGLWGIGEMTLLAGSKV